MRSIRIVATPPGDAPENIRQQWIGVVIPLCEQDPDAIEVGVLGGAPQNVGGYQVETRQAMEALREKSPEAFAWWNKNVPLDRCPHLAFAREVCQVID